MFKRAFGIRRFSSTESGTGNIDPMFRVVPVYHVTFGHALQALGLVGTLGGGTAWYVHTDGRAAQDASESRIMAAQHATESRIMAELGDIKASLKTDKDKK